MYKENKFKPCLTYKQLLNLFTSWCEWVLRQATSGPRQGKGTRAACPKDKLEFKFFFKPCTGHLTGRDKK